MSLDSRIPLNQAIRDHLITVAALQALIGNPARIYSVGGVPQSLWPGTDNAFPPYITIGMADGRQGQIQTKSEDGMEGETEIHVWSSQRSVLECQQIQAVLVDEVKLANLTLSAGHNLVLIQLSFTSTFPDESWDAFVMHGVNRWHYMTERG